MTQTNTCDDQSVIGLILQNTDHSTYSAWKCLSENCLPKLTGKLRKLGATDPVVLEDLANEALAEVLHNVLRGRFRGESELCTYLTRIAMNLWFKMLRAGKPKSGLRPEADRHTLLGKAELFVLGKLNEEEKKAFTQEMTNDPFLQEIVATVRAELGASKMAAFNPEVLENMADLPADETPVDVVALLETAFPPESTCRTILTDYYFVHGADYERLTNAHKRPNEDYKTVYERVRKQVNRCVDKIRELLKTKR